MRSVALIDSKVFGDGVIGTFGAVTMVLTI
jgi:hypothetical protein